MKIVKDRTDTMMISYSESKDGAVLIVGRKHNLIGVDIVNAFDGDEARELYTKLTEAKKNDGKKKCDRCGKLYEYYGDKLDGRTVNGVVPILTSSDDTSYLRRKCYDLCPNCMGQFAEWIKIIQQMD